MKKIFLLLLALFPLVTFAEGIPTFPMTVYGTLKVWSVDLWAGAFLTFSDGSGNVIGTYTTSRAGWYGFESTISGTSPTFSSFVGKLGISVQYGWKNYSISSITRSTASCPTSDNIVFTSDVCRYDISLIFPISTTSGGGSSGWGSSWGGGSSSVISTASTVTQTGTMTATGNTQTGSQNIQNNNTISSSSVQTQISNPIFIIKPTEAKKWKTIITQTQLKKWTQIIIYRVLPNGKEIKTGIIRVLPNGKIRFTTKLAGKYKMKIKY